MFVSLEVLSCRTAGSWTTLPPWSWFFRSLRLSLGYQLDSVTASIGPLVEFPAIGAAACPRPRPTRTSPMAARPPSRCREQFAPISTSAPAAGRRPRRDRRIPVDLVLRVHWLFRRGLVTKSAAANSAGIYMYLGYNSGSNGSYSLSGDSQLSTGFFGYVGESGNASFTQTGGVNSVSSNIIVAANYGSTATYSLSSGQLSAANLTVGYTGAGTFTQSGGTNSVSSRLYIGYGSGNSVNPGGGGCYCLSGDSQTHRGNRVPVGHLRHSRRFQQTGGTNSTRYLGIRTGGQYLLSNGTLQTGCVANLGLFDGGNCPIALKTPIASSTSPRARGETSRACPSSWEQTPCAFSRPDSTSPQTSAATPRPASATTAEARSPSPPERTSSLPGCLPASTSMIRSLATGPSPRSTPSISI